METVFLFFYFILFQEQQEELSKLKAQEKQKSLAGSWSFGLTGRRK